MNQSITRIGSALTLMLIPSAVMGCPDSGCYARNTSAYDLEITYTDTSGLLHSQVNFDHDSSIDKIKPGTQMTVSGGPGRTYAQLTVDAGCVTIAAFYNGEDNLDLHHVNWCSP